MRYSFDRKSGLLKIWPQSSEDLWHLQKVLCPNDVVSGHSTRRFKAERGNERGDSGEKKHVFLTIKLSNVEFSENANKLRLTGKILSGTPEEFVSVGEHHTIDIEVGAQVAVQKTPSAYEKYVLESAAKKSKKPKALIVAVEEKTAAFYELSALGLKKLFELENSASKRDKESFDELEKKFNSQLLTAIGEKNPPAIALIGPGFAKDAFKRFAQNQNPALSKKMFLEHAHGVLPSDVNHLLKTGLLEKMLGEQQYATQLAELEEFKKSIGRNDGLYAYGFADVKKAVELAAADKILVLDELMRKDDKTQRLLELAEKTKAALVVMESDNDAGKQFAGFQIACRLRYKIN
ncbi:mRNA surveillance protein pelota [Candidatus Micrarchaeota archaeon]|nr:mRNA surveillance protein pelota [Candidatus Micrarchaeota archaeon]